MDENFSLCIMAEVVHKNGFRYRAYYLRSFQKILIYRGKTFDTTQSFHKINYVRSEDFIRTLENYLAVQ